MNIITNTKNITLTPAISEYIEKRLEGIKKFVAHDESAVCHIEVGKISNHHKHGDIFKADIRIVVLGKDIYASAEKSDLYAAIDAVKDEVIKNLSTSKGKRIAALRKGGAQVKAMIKGLWN